MKRLTLALLLLATPAVAKPSIYTATESYCIDNVQTCSVNADCQRTPGDVCIGNRCVLGVTGEPMACDVESDCPDPGYYGGCFDLDVTYKCDRSGCHVVNQRLR